MATIADVPGHGILVVEQTSVARYVALAAGGFALPDSSGSSDRHFSDSRFPA